MKKVIYSIAFITLIFSYSESVYAQSYQRISLDSIPDVKIEKAIYYQQPLEAYNWRLKINKYEPVWYDAYSTIGYHERFIGRQEDALKYFHSSLNLSDSIKRKIIKTLNVVNVSVRYYSYFYGEIWLTVPQISDTIILVISQGSDTKVADFKLKMPEDENKKNEKLDSIPSSGITSIHFFIKEDGVVKYPSQRYVYNLLTNNEKYTFIFDLNIFKNLLYRRNKYRISDVSNGSRKFSTMEKNASKKFIKKDESNEP